MVCPLKEEEEPVTITLYVPAGVPPLPPPDDDELPPPQDGRNNRPKSNTPSTLKPRNFFLRDVNPAPSTAIPPTGRSIAYRTPGEVRSDACAAVVLTVRVEVAGPPLMLTEAWLSEHVGAALSVVVMLQVRLTAPASPFVGLTIIVDVTVSPAETVPEVGVAERVNPGGEVAVTVKLTDVLWFRDPEVPVTVTLYVPAAEEPKVLIASVAFSELPSERFSVVGLKEQLAPDGSPEQARETVPVNPPRSFPKTT